jgi:hypothetical protein
LTEEIGNQEPHPPQDLIKWMKSKRSSSTDKKDERGVKMR